MRTKIDKIQGKGEEKNQNNQKLALLKECAMIYFPVNYLGKEKLLNIHLSSKSSTYFIIKLNIHGSFYLSLNRLYNMILYLKITCTYNI